MFMRISGYFRELEGQDVRVHCFYDFSDLGFLMSNSLVRHW